MKTTPHNQKKSHLFIARQLNTASLQTTNLDLILAMAN